MQLAFDLEPAPTPSFTPTIGKHQRAVLHQNTRLVFVLQRSRRRSIGLTINEQGLKVTAPSWVSLQQIDEAVLEKFSWIQKKLLAISARQQRTLEVEANWRAGGKIAYLGRPIQLQCATPEQPLARGQVWFDGDDLSPAADQRLWLPLPPGSDDGQVRELAQGWLQKQAKLWFAKRLRHFEVTTGLVPTKWKLSAASTRWGACNSDGNITLNWRLIHFDVSTIDYVIAHELAHLKVLNHSPAFWDVVKSLYPDYLKGYQSLKGLSPGDMPAV